MIQRKLIFFLWQTKISNLNVIETQSTRFGLVNTVHSLFTSMTTPQK